MNAYSQSSNKIQNSISNCVKFLNEYGASDSCDYNLVFLVQYLSNKYQRNDLFFNMGFTPTRNQDSWITYNFYDPLIGLKPKMGDDSLNYYYKNSIGIDHILLWGIYADKLALNDEVKSILIENSQSSTSIRNLYHIALAIHWSERHKIKANQPYLQKLKRTINHLLIKKLQNFQRVDDDFLEGLAGFICLNRSGLIKKKWVEMILNEQNTDGGWAWSPIADTRSSPHPTLLAYWILLELLC